MNIYLVNRYSKLKGPYDIIDSNREHIIKVGDICLRDYVEGLAFLVVQSTDNSWNACKRIGVGKNQIVTDLGNTLLFSFDGIHQRKGNIDLLKQLLSSYKEKVIYDFFINAIEILEYKRDFWDVSLFQRFFAISQELISPIADKDQSAGLENHDYPTVFAKYLNADLLELLIASINEGKSIKEAYELLRDKDAASFRAAMMRFLVENPYGSIFEKLPYSTPPQKTEEIKTVETLPPAKEDKQIDNSSDNFDSILLQDYHNKDFKKLYKLYQKGDKKAYEQLVKNSLPLVAIVANNFRKYGIDSDDLMQEGTIGLMTALEKFNLNRKVPFPLYARWWIFQSITRYLLPFSKTIKMPQNQLSLYKRVRKYIENYEQVNGYEPSVLEIEDVAEMDSDIIYQLRNMHEDHLHQPSVPNDLDSFPSLDSLADAKLMKESRTIFVDGIISRLRKREAYILRAAYGLGQAQESLSEIAERLGLTRERVRQIVEKTVRRLRNMLTGKKVASEDEEENNDNDNKLDEQKNVPVKKEKKEKHVNISRLLNFVAEDNKKKVQAEEIAQAIIKKEVERKTQNVSVHKLKNDAEIGNVILYDAKKCIVIDKKTRDDSSRLVVKYENGSIDNVKNDPSRYKILPSEVRKYTSNENTQSQYLIKTKAFKTVFDKKATSYKYFWLLAIITLAKERRCLSISYDDILIRMAAMAWPIVLKESIELGHQDRMYIYLSEIHKRTSLTKYSSSSDIEIFLNQVKNKSRAIEILSPLLKNVPYRFLSPWIKFTSNDEVIKRSQEKDSGCLYALYDKYIILNDEWWDYIIANYNTIWDFTLDSFIEYIKRYNAHNESRLMAIKKNFYKGGI